jgi:S1-C subfamily serine protease
VTSDSAKRLAATYVQQAEEAISSGDPARAESLLDRALATDPENTRARELRGLDEPARPERVPAPTPQAPSILGTAPSMRVPSSQQSPVQVVSAGKASLLGHSLTLITVGAVVGGSIALLAALGLYFGLGATDDPSQGTVAVACRLEDSSKMVVEASVLVITDEGFGTAFHVGDGVFVTAAHVVSGGGRVVLDSELMQAEASIILIDDRADIAELQVASAVVIPSLSWSSRETIPPGLTVATVGYPVDVAGAGSLSRGVVSRLFIESGQQLIQTDVPVNPGNSGGALVDECGDVLGVVFAKWNDAGIEGIAYAVEARSAREALGKQHR